jgi:phospholipase C
MMTPDQLRNGIDTIVILIMENRSFDNVLGWLRHPQYGNRGDVDGIADLNNNDYINNNVAGQGIRPFWRSDAPTPTDFPHTSNEVSDQFGWAALTRKFTMTGFVRSFENAFHQFVQQPPVIGLLRPDDIPTTSVLASQYTVCDRWFACIPTSTAPNRLMSMCGATGIAETHIVVPDQPTVYDWLIDHGVRWRVYHAGLPFFALMPRLAPLVLTSHFRSLDDLPGDWAADAPSDRPQVIFIEPDYYDAPVHFHPPCDNHPPLAMAPGEAFVAKVYGWISSDPERWARTLFIVTYDEHGGCWDHVPPPRIAYSNPASNIRFDTTGPRTPTIVAGPFAPAGKVARNAKGDKPLLDNTSILQLLAERFGTPSTSFSPDVLARRLQGVESVSALLDPAGANTAVCQFRPAAQIPTPPPSPTPALLTQAFTGAIQQLVTRHGPEALAKFPQLRGFV